MKRVVTRATVEQPFYDYNGKKYIRIILTEKVASEIRKIHDTSTKGFVMDSLEGTILTVKVPWRYRKVDCKVFGITPVEAIEKGDQMDVTIEFCGAWDKGIFWKFISVEKVD
tara:strand:- start:526 stop:861 length:336 start_codon:yes stop_codon:yes gene_type:complete